MSSERSVSVGDEPPAVKPEFPDIICLSHLRWNFVFQRPQHLMTRLAARHRVFFVEEAQFGVGPDRLDITTVEAGVRVVLPILDARYRGDANNVTVRQRALLAGMIYQEHVRHYVLWFYTPMAFPVARALSPLATVYDCMDELTGFAGAPPELAALETELLSRAQLVTTGGQSLYEAKKTRHPNVHAFPSSVDRDHFATARGTCIEPDDQAAIPRPRIGFAGVIDERMDLTLLRGLADARPDWHIVLLGPVAKIDPQSLPQSSNLHYLGMKPYTALPNYLAGWDVGILPFAHNAATRFISPTKTPEYLAAGLPVVATSIRDIVDPYGKLGLARIADGVGAFVTAVDRAVVEGRGQRLAAVDELLAHNSWDATAYAMRLLMLQAVAAQRSAAAAERSSYLAEVTP